MDLTKDYVEFLLKPEATIITVDSFSLNNKPPFEFRKRTLAKEPAEFLHEWGKEFWISGAPDAMGSHIAIFNVDESDADERLTYFMLRWVEIKI